MTFEAETAPPPERVRELSEATPWSPFNSAAYAEATATPSMMPCLLTWRSKSNLEGCLAFTSGRRRFRRLVIPTAPRLSAAGSFWTGVLEFCNARQISELQIDSFASREPTLPAYPYPCETAVRSEFVLDLSDEITLDSMSKNHRRNIRKAAAKGVVVRRSTDPRDSAGHVELIMASMSRRSARGETIAINDEAEPYRRLLQAGAGELFQAWLDDELLASLLILRTEHTGYYQTAGTNPDGMSLGASPYLVTETAKLLAADRLRWFNLGGAGNDSTGLRRFKKGFGSEEISLQAARYSFASPLARIYRKAMDKVARTGKRS